uniref:Uncharacterized protein n=1 Tax=Aegilops tauschii subsp. strangulata TaxID=200361 RepID=A0A453JRT2_AEGTS
MPMKPGEEMSRDKTSAQNSLRCFAFQIDWDQTMLQDIGIVQAANINTFFYQSIFSCSMKAVTSTNTLIFGWCFRRRNSRKIEKNSPWEEVPLPDIVPLLQLALFLSFRSPILLVSIMCLSLIQPWRLWL